MLDFSCLDRVRRRRPLIHCVSNQVSANDCANLVLAVGASPVMAYAPEELEELTAAGAALVLNTGTPDASRFACCRLWGAEAVRQGRPVVLDPVGAGGSAWRLGQVRKLLDAFTPAILRVNLGEALALLGESGRERGVDSAASLPPEARARAAAALAKRLGTAVLLSGPEDFAADGEQLWRIAGGSALTARVTGTGCMLSALCGVFAAVEEDALRSALAASAFWKACAALAEESAGGRGPGSFRAALLDAAWRMTPGEAAGITVERVR